MKELIFLIIEQICQKNKKEQRAISAQKQHSSYDKTTTKYKQTIDEYEKNNR